MPAFKLVSVAIASLALVPAAAAWEYGVDHLGELEFVHFATTQDIAGTSDVIFGCNVLKPGIVQFQMITPKDGGADQPAPVSVSAAGQTFTFDATLSANEGRQLVFTDGEAGIGAAAEAIAATAEPVTISFGRDSYSIPGGASTDAFASMMAECG